MMVSFSCDRCGRRLKAKPEHAGRRAKCIACGKILRIPSPGPESGPGLLGDSDFERHPMARSPIAAWRTTHDEVLATVRNGGRARGGRPACYRLDEEPMLYRIIPAVAYLGLGTAVLLTLIGLLGLLGPGGSPERPGGAAMLVRQGVLVLGMAFAASLLLLGLDLGRGLREACRLLAASNPRGQGLPGRSRVLRRRTGRFDRSE